jgi:hypothetical protein
MGYLPFGVWYALICVNKKSCFMEDLVIPGIVRSVFIGTVVGMTSFGPLGWKIFGPIYGNSDIWFLIGGLLGVALFVHYHFKLKNEQLNQKNDVK